MHMTLEVHVMIKTCLSFNRSWGTFLPHLEPRPPPSFSPLYILETLRGLMLHLISPTNMLIFCAKCWEEATPSAFSPPKLASGSALSGPQVCAKALPSV